MDRGWDMLQATDDEEYNKDGNIKEWLAAIVLDEAPPEQVENATNER